MADEENKGKQQQQQQNILAKAFGKIDGEKKKACEAKLVDLLKKRDAELQSFEKSLGALDEQIATVLVDSGMTPEQATEALREVLSA